jgi:MFS family permease
VGGDRRLAAHQPMTRRPDPEPIPEDVEESLLEGDDYPTHRKGTARAAFAHRDFRVMWFGSFGSNVGSWMQQVVLGSYAYRLTGSGAFVGLLGFAQLGPLLLLSIPGGVLADVVDRRRLLVLLQAAQGVFSLLLAYIVAASDDPSKAALFGCVLGIGIANALNAPAWSTVLPALVGQDDLPGAISLNSTMINGTRVIGPAIAGVLYPITGASWIFVINAVTYLFVIGALYMVHFPAIPKAAERGWQRVSAGFRVARADAVVGRILLILPIFSLFCLPFVTLFAPLAEIDLGLNSKTLAYGLLYASFGLGAALGSLAIGTVLVERDKATLVRVGLAGFAVAVMVFGLLRHPAPAYIVVFVLGAVYFGTTTSMLTIVQSRVGENVRGRVMSLWFMGFGGTVPIGGLLFGPILDATSGTVVLTVSAIVALLLALFANLEAAERRSAAVLA